MKNKPIKAIKVLASKGKLRIGIDQNIKGIIPDLQNKGYTNIYTPIEGTDDPIINRELNDKNIKFFFTENDRHFQRFSNRHYALVSVKNLTGYQSDGKADIIDLWLRRFKGTIGSHAIYSIDAEGIKELKRLNKTS